MSLLSLSCRCGVERGSVVPAWSRTTSIIVIIHQIIQFNMFTYPPSPLIRARDNLVSNGHGSSPTMHSGIGVGMGEEEQILLIEILRRCDSILETLRAFSSGGRQRRMCSRWRWRGGGGGIPTAGNVLTASAAAAMGIGSGGDALAATGGDGAIGAIDGNDNLWRGRHRP
jgi:hypothetical protein